jgi:hypothetical protein
MTTEEKLRGIMRKDIATCEHILTIQGVLPPAFIIHAPGIVHIIGAQADSGRARARMMQIIRTFCIAREANIVSYLTEAWMAEIKNDDKTSIGKAERDGVRSLPNRIEAVMALTEYRRDDETLGRLSQCHPIERNDRKQVIGLGLDMFKDDMGATMTGRMTRLLLPKAPTPEMVAIAKAALEKFGPELHHVETTPAN